MILIIEMLLFVPSYLLKYLKSRTFILLLALFVLSWVTDDSPSFSDTTGLAMLLAAFAVMPWAYINGRRDYLKRLRDNNLERYKREHPEKVSRQGRVRCFSCDGDRIFVRKIRDQTYMQEHVCTQCGKTLYYSKEG